MKPSAQRDHAWVQWALLLGTLALFSQSLGHEYIGLDDQLYVGKNIVQQGFSFPGLLWSCSLNTGANWIPLTWLSHMLDFELFGSWPGGHHASNVLVHALNSCLLYRLLRRFTDSTGRSALVAVLFALHPLQVESVAWVAERKDVLSTLFGFLCLNAYARGAKSPSRLSSACVLLFYTCSLMSKAMLVTLPCLLVILDAWPLRRLLRADGSLDAGSLWRSIRDKLPLVAIALAVSLLTLYSQEHSGAMRSMTERSLSDRLLHAPIAYCGYLTNVFWPSKLCIFYPMAAPGIARAFIAALSLIALLILGFRVRRSAPWVLVGELWFLGTLVPVIGIIAVGNQASADRYTYFPIIGVFIALVWSIPERWLKSWTTRLTLLVMLAFLASSTWTQLGYWRNDIRLFRHALSVTKNNDLAHGLLGYALEKRGRYSEAVEQHILAVQIKPNSSSTQTDLGVSLAALGRHREAARCFAAAIRIQPESPWAYLNLASTNISLGRAVAARKIYEELLGRGLMKAHASLGLAGIDRAEKDYSRSVERLLGILKVHATPDMAGDRAKAAELRRSGQLPEAVKLYEALARRAVQHIETGTIKALHY